MTIALLRHIFHPLIFITISLLSFKRTYGQVSIDDSLKAKRKVEYGFGLVVGNHSSPHGLVGVTANLILFKNTQADLGFGWVEPKINLGVKQAIPISNHISLFLSVQYVHLISDSYPFETETPNYRIYRYSAANSLAPNLGIDYNIYNRDHQGTFEHLIVWFAVGYNYFFKNNSTIELGPGSNTGANAADIDKIKRELYTNGIVFNIGGIMTFSTKRK